MSGDFLSQADLWAWVYELTKVKPGDFGSLNDNDDAAIRARHHACTPTEVWHFDPLFAGIAGGETGV